MIIVGSKDFVKSDFILPFENLAINGNIRCDMKEAGHHDGWGMVSYFKENFPEYLEREPHSVTLDSEHFKKGAKFINIMFVSVMTVLVIRLFMKYYF